MTVYNELFGEDIEFGAHVSECAKGNDEINLILSKQSQAVLSKKEIEKAEEFLDTCARSFSQKETKRKVKKLRKSKDKSCHILADFMEKFEYNIRDLVHQKQSEGYKEEDVYLGTQRFLAASLGTMITASFTTKDYREHSSDFIFDIAITLICESLQHKVRSGKAKESVELLSSLKSRVKARLTTAVVMESVKHKGFEEIKDIILGAINKEQEPKKDTSPEEREKLKNAKGFNLGA